MTCEFEPLLSAMIDGELAGNDLARMEAHLQQCAACQKNQRQFIQVDSATRTLGTQTLGSQTLVTSDLAMLTSVPVSRKNTLASSDRQQQQSNESPRWWRWVPVAVSSSVVIGLVVAAWPSSQPIEASTMTAEEIAQPLAELQMINQQNQRDQSVMLKTLELELRSLRLEVTELGKKKVPAASIGNPPNGDEAVDEQAVDEEAVDEEDVLLRLDQLIQRVNDFGNDAHKTTPPLFE